MDESNLGFAVAAAAAVVGGIVIWAATKGGKKEVSFVHRCLSFPTSLEEVKGGGGEAGWRYKVPSPPGGEVATSRWVRHLKRRSWQAFLDKTRQEVVLSEKIQLSHDTYLYRFALPKKSMMLGLPVGKHFKVRSTLMPSIHPGGARLLGAASRSCRASPPLCLPFVHVFPCCGPQVSCPDKAGAPHTHTRNHHTRKPSHPRHAHAAQRTLSPQVFAPSPKGSVSGQWNGLEDSEQGRDEVERKYTPTTSDDDLGKVDLVIKVYRPGKTYKPPRERFREHAPPHRAVRASPLSRPQSSPPPNTRQGHQRSQ